MKNNKTQNRPLSYIGGVIGAAFAPPVGTVVGKVVGSTVGIAIGTIVVLVMNYALENTKSKAKGAWNK